MRVEEEEPYGLKNELVRSIVKAKFERGENFHYRWVPLSCVREVDRLRGWVMRGLDAIACPTLIMHAHEDELTSARSAHFLRDGIADSRLVLLDNSYHMICVDNDRDRVAAEVLRFMDRAAEAPQPSRLQSLDGEDAQRLLSAYRESLRAGEFETLFPCSPTTWSGPRKATARSAASIGKKRADRSVLPADGLFAQHAAHPRGRRAGAARPRFRHAAALPGPGRSRPAGKRRDPYAAAARQCHHPRQFRGGRSAARARYGAGWRPPAAWSRRPTPWIRRR